MKKWLLCLLLVTDAFTCLGQTRTSKSAIYTDDIDRFWVAYDSVRATPDRIRQIAVFNRLYIRPGSEGLHAFMEAREFTAEKWVDLINKLPKFWTSIRPNTLVVKTKTRDIDRSIHRLRRLYPELREAKMYFTVGGLRSGGTVRDNLVLVGTEITMGTPSTDVSEFSNQWLAGVFRHQSLDNIVPLNVHEYVHTQQRPGQTNLLGQALKEGACDFVTELVVRKPLQASYLRYGAAHAPELQARFKEEMFGDDMSRWLYNGTSVGTTADLGYFIGYSICKRYYAQAENKRQAIKDIIELDYANPEATERFLAQAGYYPEGWDKPALLTALQARYPVVAGLAPFRNGATTVDAGVRELVIQFSQEMDEQGMSFNMGPRGQEYFPLKKPVGFSADGKQFRLSVELQPNHEYEFVVTTRSFRSRTGYPLRENYTVHFKTK
ncbi:DUF2268 domain-containing protein [Hymenobacter sp. HSC-4F20]|uniref:DUF2268 domain-containing protein n=1 Tax=Hymenobacter sp. HSC-4F20 TaxID=2864135 RepID=UPI001C731BFE|nr:DUF2268 domain-containing protein [Hymenobacter sp. HSC-4F20]MBX0290863.1 DUF2268 domain-containing protein [Hymenobacter sp. HSC-4F20]